MVKPSTILISQSVTDIANQIATKIEIRTKTICLTNSINLQITTNLVLDDSACDICNSGGDNGRVLRVNVSISILFHVS